jgi:predicted AlkP superfamily pyrophosphatase or phosphodiesterase
VWGAKGEDWRTMQRVAVLNVVGLTSGLLGGGGMPRLAARARRDGVSSFCPAFPAVTCTAQSSMLTGRPVAEHGVVGNGWYERDSGEVRFWKQGNGIVQGEKIWDRLRRECPGFTCANTFWWFNMHSSVDIAATPRPLYPADGRKVFDIHTQPMGLREELKAELGDFPFPAFWGPVAGIGSSRWIADAARWIDEKSEPTLQLVYLPHLDYGLQRRGPDAPEVAAELQAIDEVAGMLADDLEKRGVKVMIVSEYGIAAVSRQVHLNRVFRERGWLAIKDELGRDAMVAGDSKVFAVADHQVAHVYVRDHGMIGDVRKAVEKVDGVETVRDGWGESVGGRRGGDLVAVAEADAWFTYYFWEDDARAPDYARCVDIHRKPGYDPAELFFDPAIRFPKVKVAAHVGRVKAGMRSLLELVPLDGGLVRGSHGRDEVAEEESPVVIGAKGEVGCAEDVFGEMERAVRGE